MRSLTSTDSTCCLKGDCSVVGPISTIRSYFHYDILPYIYLSRTRRCWSSRIVSSRNSTADIPVYRSTTEVVLQVELCLHCTSYYKQGCSCKNNSIDKSFHILFFYRLCLSKEPNPYVLCLLRRKQLCIFTLHSPTPYAKSISPSLSFHC